MAGPIAEGVSKEEQVEHPECELQDGAEYDSQEEIQGQDVGGNSQGKRILPVEHGGHREEDRNDGCDSEGQVEDELPCGHRETSESEPMPFQGACPRRDPEDDEQDERVPSEMEEEQRNQPHWLW